MCTLCYVDVLHDLTAGVYFHFIIYFVIYHLVYNTGTRYGVYVYTAMTSDETRKKQF